MAVAANPRPAAGSRHGTAGREGREADRSLPQPSPGDPAPDVVSGPAATPSSRWSDRVEPASYVTMLFTTVLQIAVTIAVHMDR
ncbi:MAG: hypothetical protein JWQ03_3192 [Variovorax sp.]|nr:hypothetical protein [Variovorax sp.]